MIDEATFQVLNSVYLRKLAPVSHIVSVTGIPEQKASEVVANEMADEALDELAGSYILQPKGTGKVLKFYHDTYAPLRDAGEVIEWYDRFEVINVKFIKAVSDWQSGGGKDSRAQDQMTRIVEKMMRNLEEVIPDIPRYKAYSDRFARSMALADRGETDYVCNPTVDSMHNIWFEFHEDILAVIGRPRDV